MTTQPASQEPDGRSAKEESSASASSQTSTTSSLSGWQRGWLYAALAMEFVGGVVGGGVAGYFLDRSQGTSPLWTIILLVSGCAAGLYLLVRGITKLEGQSS